MAIKYKMEKNTIQLDSLHVSDNNIWPGNQHVAFHCTSSGMFLTDKISESFRSTT